MGVCTCYDGFRCQGHGGTIDDEIKEARDAIRELTEELTPWKRSLAKLLAKKTKVAGRSQDQPEAAA